MTITLYHHPLTRAASVVWQLEEVGVPYSLAFVDLKKGEHKTDTVISKNTMGKVPVLVDHTGAGDVVVSETAAIGLYLADRYAPGTLAPALDDPARGPFLRWCFFASNVVEPVCLAKAAGWKVNPQNAGFGSFDDMLATVRAALAGGPWLLGERFTMADVIVGATVRYMLQFKMMPAEERFVAYSKRLAARPALQKANAVNAAVIETPPRPLM
jgi:glutathione S-transferase